MIKFLSTHLVERHDKPFMWCQAKKKWEKKMKNLPTHLYIIGDVKYKNWLANFSDCTAHNVREMKRNSKEKQRTESCLSLSWRDSVARVIAKTRIKEEKNNNLHNTIPYIPSFKFLSESNFWVWFFIRARVQPDSNRNKSCYIRSTLYFSAHTQRRNNYLKKVQ